VNLKLEKENVTTGYRRLASKYKKLEAKVNVLEREKTDIAEVNVGELNEIEEKLAKEMWDYTDYRWNVQHGLRELHEVLKASLWEVGERCLRFLAKNDPVEDYISWFEEELKVVPGVVGQLNDQFVVLSSEGVLNKLYSPDCQELLILHDLATSSDASVVEDVPGEVQKIAGCLVRRWWKNHGLPEALHWLEGSNAETVSFANT
jgi:hypothetical protein